MQSTICPTCAQAVDTDFCPHCGESQHHKRLSLKIVLLDIPNAVINFERGLLHTIKMLIIQPGNVIRSYLAGSRIQHYRPLNFLFLLGGLYTLLYSTVLIQGVIQASGSHSQFNKFIDEQALQLQAFLLLLQLPLISLASWLFFKKRGYYYGEHLIANAYLMGELTLFPLLMFPLCVIFNHTAVVDAINIIYLLLICVYMVRLYNSWLSKPGESVIGTAIAIVLIDIIIIAVTYNPLMALIYLIKISVFGAG